MSPSRLMAIMDPLLNTGFLWRCLAAYAGIRADDDTVHDQIEVTRVTQSDDRSLASKQSAIDPADMLASSFVPSNTDDTSKSRANAIRDDQYYARLGLLMRIIENSIIAQYVSIAQVKSWARDKLFYFENCVNQLCPIILTCRRCVLRMKSFDNFRRPISL
jgi:hypothetical protein